MAGYLARGLRRLPALPLLGALLALPGCGTIGNLGRDIFGGGPAEGSPGFVRGFLGGVAAEDPAAALAARQVLSAGGSATDAAVAAGFTMAVTLPSRVGLGGGGACLVFDPQKGSTDAVMFLPGARPASPQADRPAAVPLLARGLFALHTRKPVRPFEELMAAAEQTARFGTEVSRGLAADLAAVSGPLFADPGARAVFARPDGRPKGQGEALLQPELAASLGQLRIAGVGDLHQGALARRLEQVSASAGAGLTYEMLRAALPDLLRPFERESRGGDRIAFLPPPADGGVAAAVAFEALRNGASYEAAAAQALAVAGTLRQQGGDPAALVTAQGLAPWRPAALPASAGLVVFDRTGTAVTCAFTLNNLFGTGRMAPGMGFLLAAAPGLGQVQPPLLSAAIAYNPNLRAFRMGLAGSGQEAAPMAVGAVAAQHLLNRMLPAAALEAMPAGPGRTQLGACLNYLPGYPDRCVALTDPRGSGVALGAIDD
ncbi:gamma-glutamyltransferase family protein [Siccirubricoccus sp. KC 17139]|uniref:Gamma-glutamyltransferase family protein n=1 Tax=Siccirubricoccus soli TaxID=2899147 RepID=A0ABT1D4T5_9PROT|nr:gamma-glutamyltransferase [Siccirubricoccus soli]MCO6416947.1 gamma-glutamyltransferase family protein [Siccirubricoccus soli]MCP2683082.1 gamma-glutamyltransferase family protein [Siccirubricoccus soli]